MFREDLDFLELYADYIKEAKGFFSGLDVFDNIIYNKNIGFGLMSYLYFCPEDLIDKSYCLKFNYKNPEQRGKDHAETLTKSILENFQKILQSLPSSVGFFDHNSEEWKSKRIELYH